MEHKINQFLVDSTLIFESLSSNSDDYIYIWDYQNGNYITSDNLAQDFTIASQGAILLMFGKRLCMNKI